MLKTAELNIGHNGVKEFLKLVVVEFLTIFRIAVVEFPTIFVIKFLSGMSLPRKINGNSSFYYSAYPSGPWTAKTTVPIYISRKCLTMVK